jgi:hypothetical protein
MKTVTGILLAIMMMGMLAGCYSKSCEQPPAAYKGEG